MSDSGVARLTERLLGQSTTDVDSGILENCRQVQYYCQRCAAMQFSLGRGNFP